MDLQRRVGYYAGVGVLSNVARAKQKRTRVRDTTNLLACFDLKIRNCSSVSSQHLKSYKIYG